MRRIESQANIVNDYSILPRVLKSITLYEWKSANVGNKSFTKSGFADVKNLDETLLDALNRMYEGANGHDLVAYVSKSRTCIQATISLKDMLTFIVANYVGDLSVF